MNWWEFIICAFAVLGVVVAICYCIKECFLRKDIAPVDTAPSVGHDNSIINDCMSNIASVRTTTSSIEGVVRNVLLKIDGNREIEQKSFEINLKDNGRIQSICNDILFLLNSSVIPMIQENARLNNMVRELEAKNRELTTDIKELIQASKGTLYDEENEC